MILRRPVVLSVQTPQVGHRTYATVLRAALEHSGEVDVRSYWNIDRAAPWALRLSELLCRSGPIRWTNSRNLDFLRLRSEFAHSLLTRLLLARVLHRERPALLHLHTQSLALLSIHLMRRIPSVISGDLTAPLAARMYTSKLWRWTYLPNAWLERAAFRSARAVVMFSEWAKRSVVDDYGVPTERVHVIRPGVRLRAFEGLERLRAAAGARPLRILFVGADYGRKGGPLLARVFLERFAERGIELHFMTKALDVPRHPQIVVHRDVEAYSPRWLELYANSDVFALPTRGEAFGFAYIEAMAASLPVIGTNVGAGREIIADGSTGFIIPRDDANGLADRLERLLGDAALRKQFGERGRARVEQLFDADHHAEAIAHIFAGLAAKRC